MTVAPFSFECSDCRTVVMPRSDGVAVSCECAGVVWSIGGAIIRKAPTVITDPPFTVSYQTQPVNGFSDSANTYPETPERIVSTPCPKCAQHEDDLFLVTAVSVLLQVCEAEEVAACLTESQQAAVERVRAGMA